MPSTLRNAVVWCLLVLVPTGWIALSSWEEGSSEGAPEAHEAREAHDSHAGGVGTMTVLQGRLLVGIGAAGLDAPDPLGTRPVSRLAAAMLLARAGQPDRAEAQWKLATEATPHAPDPSLAASVHCLITDWPQPEQGERAKRPDALGEAQWSALQEQLGWFGDLARADFTDDASAAQRAHGGEQALTLTMLAAGVWFLLAGLAGGILLVTLLALAIAGRVRSAIEAMPRTQSVLGETFVAWMLLFLGLHVALGRLGGDGEPSVARLVVGMAATFASLAALVWARWRGLSWADLRQAAGLRFEGGPWRLAWLSGASYLCALPCMGAGIAAGMLMADWLGGRSFQDVSHPVQEMLPGASTGVKVALFLVAGVAAPVVEETAFRGLLYGHVRQQASRWPRALSIAFAMLFSATVFAAIHPQGVLAVPALAGVSLGFCITREWSGSVLPGMVAHGLHNGVLLALNVALQSA